MFAIPVAPFLVSIVIVAGLGCASGTAVQVPGTPTPTPQKTPVLVLDKLDVDIGSLSGDQQAVQTFLIGNLGGQDLHVQVVDLKVLEGCDAVEVARDPTTVLPRKVAQLPVTIGPHRELGSHRYSLTLESNDPARASRTLSVRFNVTEPAARKTAGPDLVVDKRMIDIGDVPYDWPMYEVFTLRNAGDKPLVIDGMPVVRIEEGC